MVFKGGRLFRKIVHPFRPIDLTIGPVTKIGNRLKGALKTPSTLDGEPISIEAIEIPTVWECLIDNQLQAGNNIYNSVTSKLRREKGQSLDAFMTAFMHSVEQCPEIGEDVMDMKIEKVKLAYNIPGNNTVFGNLFDIRRGSKLYSGNLEAATGELHVRMAPSQCLIYILVNIMRAPKVLTRLVLAFCSISQKTIDSLINNLLQKLLLAGLYQPRLAKLVSLLESHLFGDKQPSPTAQELFVRQQTARIRLKEVHHSLTGVFDVLQYPALNKHLMYSLVDVVLSEIYPEFEY
jgi:sorting nexin-14